MKINIGKIYSRLPAFAKRPGQYKKQWLAIVAAVIALWAIIFFLKPPQEAQATWWNDGWMYRKKVEITNSSGSNLTDFQVAITLDTASLISAGKMQSDCDDIRITDINGKTLHYFLSNCNSSTSHMWVKLPSIPTSGTTIYLYYGNPAAISVSNAQKTFDFTTESVTGASNAYSNNVSGVSVSTVASENGVTSLASNHMIKFVGTIDDTNNPYAYYKLSDPSGEYLHNYVVQDGDFLTFFVYNYDTPGVGMEINFTDGSVLRWNHEDQDNIDAMLENTNANGYWYWRYIDISDMAGKTINYISIVQEDPTPSVGDNWIGYFNHMVIRQYSSDVSITSLGSEEQSPGPVAYWKFDEGHGTTANDSTQNNNDGTITGATWQAEDMCVSGKCLYFDGNDTVAIADDNSLDFGSSDFTVAVWVKHGEITDHSGYIAKGQSGRSQAVDGYPTFALRHYKTGPVFFIEDGNNNVSVHASNANTEDNRWHYIVGVREGDYIKIYVDGKLINTANASSVGSINNSNPLVIGRQTSTGGQYLNGIIDEVKIYPYARSAAQIKADYAARGSVKGVSAQIGAGGTEESLANGLVGYWKMDESGVDTEGETISDLSGNGNTGTLYGDDGVDDNGSGMDCTSAGKYGTACEFDGIDDYVYLSNPSDLLFTNQSFTITAWFKPDDVAGSDQDIIVGRYQGGSWIYTIYKGTGLNEKKLIVARTEAVAGIIASTSSEDVFENDEWSFIACVYDRSNNTLRCYENGVELTMSNSTGVDDLVSNGYYSIGSNTDPWNLGGSYADGLIDEVRIYNRALSPAEVRALYEWAPGPVLHLKMDEGVSGDSQTIYDNSGNGNNGTTSDANSSGMNCSVPGKFGKACEFDGVDDFISLGDTLDIGNGSQTIGAWIKTNDNSVRQGILVKGGAGSYTYNFEILSSRLSYALYNTGATYYLQAQTSDELPSDEWLYVTGVYDAVLDKISIYVNGVLKESSSSTSGIKVTDTSANLIVGSRWNGESAFFNGKIDDVRIYNYARTQKQIVEDMNAGHPIGGSPVGSQRLYWKFDEGYGTTAHDSSSQNNSGTLGCAGTTCSLPTWKNDGKFGKALYFYNSVSSDRAYVTRSPINIASTTGTKMTWTMWIKPDASQVGGGWLMRNGIVEDENYGLNLGSPSDGYYKVRFQGYDTTFRGIWTTDYIVPAQEWSHLAVVYSQGEWMKVYLNGVFKEQVTWSYGNTVQATSSFNIGGHNGAYQNYNGYIDEVKVYDGELTEDEVRLDYNQGKTLVMGAISTESDGSTPSFSSSREYCVPGDTSSCSPPAAEWRFDEKTGTTVYDTSGNGNDGSLINMETEDWQPGKKGSALRFDGVNEYIDLGDVLNLSLPVSVSLWFKLDSLTEAENLFASEVYAAAYRGFRLSVQADGDLEVSYGSNGTGSSGRRSKIATANIQPGIWYHVTGVIRGATDMDIYLNGKDIGGTYDGSGGALYNGTSSAGIAIQDRNDGYFPGLIDEVRVYDYARTPAQVAWEYNRGKPIGWWKFDECQGATAYDSSGNGNNGTINIGASGSQTSAGTCADGQSNSAWYNGVNGKYNSSLNLDGIDDMATITDPSGGELDFGTDGDFSVFAWIKGTGSGGIVTKREPTTLEGYRLYISNGRPYSVVDTTGTDCVEDTSVSRVNDGNWHLIGFTADRDSNVKFYTDGILVDTCDSATNNGTVSNDENLKIGTDRLGGNLWGGQIDDVRIYNYALTPLQVKNLYNEGAAVRFGN